MFALNDHTNFHKLEFEAGTSNSIILSESEIKAIRALLPDAERDASIVDVDYRDEHVARVERLRVAIAPHKKLPAEILAHIFIHCLDDVAIFLPPPTTTTPPWVLRQVCWRWRQIALSDNRLWNRVILEMPIMGPEERLIRTFDLTHKVLPRSGPLSISLTGWWPSDSSGVPRDVVRPHLAIDSLIKPNAARIRELRLAFSMAGFLEFYNLPSSSFTSLESLGLHFFPGRYVVDSQVELYRDTAIFDMAHNLRSLKIVGNDPILPTIILAQRIPWAQLTDLDLKDLNALTMTEASDILQQCTNLVTCTLSVWATKGNVTPGEEIVLPCLRSMTLSVHGSSFFERLVLPSLTKLHIEDYIPLPAREIISMINRSSCMIEVFSQSQGEGSGIYRVEAMDSLLAVLPSVMEFKVADLVLPKSTLEKIGRRELLPQLTILTCCLESLEAFVEMLEMRLHNVAHSKRLRYARGMYSEDEDDTPAVDIDTGIARMERFKQLYGPDFTLKPLRSAYSFLTIKR